ncbi:MAG: FtsK/SpoIIIE domain-containing protein [Candidatus Pristimantibacillus lignocellulolyticus]|uniref:FtsK/SpoIIIE domain-containing protein n=1 Tax=Candidatus Pristimantibacillus lignocellulolyticus TaxID=2994561 RepID=A0A9J6ZET1_9BACL|nr:MAG: FtsK/SpoIIIE domain-containing protein [Candidatus Pristimantibacillus lignocellulolyticus]
MFSIAVFTVAAKSIVAASGACAIVYKGYQMMPGPAAQLKLMKLFKDGNVYKPIKRIRSNATYEVKQYPEIKRVGVYEDHTQLIFSVPDGMNPQEITSKLWLFKQGFGERIDLTGDSKTFNLEIYKVELKTFDYYLEEIKEAVKGYNLPILAGKTRKGYIVYDMCEHPHLLVAGETGSGKSVQLRSILTTLITCASDKLELYCADLKRTEFHLFRGIAKTVDIEPLHLQTTLLKINKELVRRGNLLDKHELSNINDLPESVRPKYIVLAVDEVALLKKEKVIMGIIEDISAIGRALGVFLILSMQRPDADILDGKLKNNLTVRMAFRHADEINSRITLGTGEATHIKQSQKGRFYLSLEGLRQTQAPYLDLAKAKEILAPYKRLNEPKISNTNKIIEVTDYEVLEEVSSDFIEFGVLDNDNER